MTKVNKPRVSMVAGRVRIKRIGFKNVFTTPRTTETSIAVTNESIDTPGITRALI